MHRGKHKKDKKGYVESVRSWLKSPGWFTKLYVNRPEKAKGKQWETKMKKVSLADIEDHEHPLEPRSKEEQRYYW